MAKLGVDDVIEMVCNNEMDESDDSDDEFDGYLECEEMERLLGESKTDESDDEECVPIGCDVNECVNEMEFAVRHELDKMDVDECDEVECKNDELSELFMVNEVPDEMHVDEYEDSAVSAASSACPPSTVPSALPPTIPSTISVDTSTGKCKIDMSNKSPIDFFKMLVTLDILDNIVDQTNVYANQFFEKHSAIPPRSRLHSWKKKILSVSELLKFLALIVVMGVVRLPRMEDHWVQKWPFGSHSFGKIMTRDRFSLILKFFHVNDSSKYVKRGEVGHDPLYKIRPLLTSLLHNFNQWYTPNKELSLDEAMVSFKGRAWFLQYMPKKPKKWGLKAFSLADAKTGYTLNWKLYAGMSDYHYNHAMLCTVICLFYSHPISVNISSNFYYRCCKVGFNY